MRSIREVCSKDYSKEQIDGWGGRPFDADHWRRAIDDQHVWVVDSNGIVQGLGYLVYSDERHVASILALYLVPEVIGKGFGREMVAQFIEKALHLGACKISLASTCTAKVFYESCGFKQTGPEVEASIGGRPIACHPMELLLD